MYDTIEVVLLPGLEASQLFCNSINKAYTKHKWMQY